MQQCFIAKNILVKKYEQQNMLGKILVVKYERQNMSCKFRAVNFLK